MAIERVGYPSEGRILVPTERVRSMKGGVRKESDRKLYPGYVFIELELDKNNLELALRCVEQIRKCVEAVKSRVGNDPENALAWLNMGTAQALAGQVDGEQQPAGHPPAPLARSAVTSSSRSRASRACIAGPASGSVVMIRASSLSSV